MLAKGSSSLSSPVVVTAQVVAIDMSLAWPANDGLSEAPERLLRPPRAAVETRLVTLETRRHAEAGRQRMMRGRREGMQVQRIMAVISISVQRVMLT